MPGEKGAEGDKGGPGIDGNIFLIKAETGQPIPPEYYIWIEIINSVLNNTAFGDKGEPGPQGPAGADGVKGEPGLNGNPGIDGTPGMDGKPGKQGEKGAPGPGPGPQGPQGDKGDTGAPGKDGPDGENGPDGEPGQKGLAAVEPGEMGEPGLDGAKGAKGPDGLCEPINAPACNCDTHTLVVHSQTADKPDCPADFISLWSGYSLLFFEGEGYGNTQDLGRAGSCLEEFQLVPFMQCAGNEVCRHGVRADKSFWLAVEAEADYTVKPMSSIDEIVPHISRCTVCSGTQFILTRHSFTAESPECPDDFTPLWEGYSYAMVTSSGVSGGGQDLASSGSCLQQFHLPTFIECLGRGTCAYYINNLDYWLGQNPDITQPGMWGMGNVYSGLDEILDQGVARCTVCTRNAIED